MLKNSVNSVGTLRVRSEKETFGFKKLLELVWTLVYVFQRSMKLFHVAAYFAIAKQVNEIKLLLIRFVCKEIALNELNSLFFAHYFSRLSACYYYSRFLLTNGKPVYATARH